MMAVMAMMGTSEYIRVVSTRGFGTTGLFVAMATHRDKKKNQITKTNGSTDSVTARFIRQRGVKYIFI